MSSYAKDLYRADSCYPCDPQSETEQDELERMRNYVAETSYSRDARMQHLLLDTIEVAFPRFSTQAKTGFTRRGAVISVPGVPYDEELEDLAMRFKIDDISAAGRHVLITVSW